MISGAPSSFPNVSQGLQIYGNVTPTDDVVSSSSLEPTQDSHSNSLLYSFSLLKERVHQIQSLVSILISPHHHHHTQPPTAAADPASIAMANMGTVIQEIIITASSMMFTCQQMSLGSSSTPPPAAAASQPNSGSGERGQTQTQSFYSSETLDNWYDDDHNYTTATTTANHDGVVRGVNGGISAAGGYDIVELDAADLLAKYTHYCQVCGKGFKRDANLRMHMRAHGDEYKSSAALINPMKNNNGRGEIGSQDGGPVKLPKKYSCPQEGCRWNRKHAKFQPLKSMICVKNHYKRSHCPKMYVCKRCNRKNFSVLSDLRTHEKHCGDLHWQCSCGTTFSRKDKLLGHVALFVGHTPAVKSLMKMGKVVECNNQAQMRVDN